MSHMITYFLSKMKSCYKKIATKHVMLEIVARKTIKNHQQASLAASSNSCLILDNKKVRVKSKGLS